MGEMINAIKIVLVFVLTVATAQAEEVCSIYNHSPRPLSPRNQVEMKLELILGMYDAAQRAREASRGNTAKARAVNYYDVLTTLGLEGLWPENSRYRHQICGGEYAASVLLERARRLGHDHPYLQRLAENQIRNGLSCGWRRDSNISPLAENWGDLQDALGEVDAIATDDFAYLKASASFYQKDFEEARRQYAVLANDNASLHRDAARLMQIRTLRAQQKFDEAYALAKRYRTQAQGRLKEWIDQQEDLIGIHSQSPEYAAERLEKVYRRRFGLPIENEEAGFRYDQADRDFYLFFAYEHQRLGRAPELSHDWWLRDETSGLNNAYLAVQRLSKEYEAIDWIQSFHASMAYIRDNTWFAGPDFDVTDDAYSRVTEHAYKEWKTENRLHWALIVAARIDQESPYAKQVIDLVDDMQKRATTCDLSEGEYYLYVAMLTHAVRIAAGQEDYETAFRLLEKASDNRFYTSPAQIFSTESAFLKVLMIRSRFDLLRKYKAEIASKRRVSMLDIWVADGEKDFLEAAGYSVLDLVNMVGDDTLAKFLNSADGRSQSLNSQAAPTVARILWMRGFVDNNIASMQEAEPHLLRAYPELRPYFRIAAAKKSQVDRRRVFVQMILRNPGLSPIFYQPRNNKSIDLSEVMVRSPIEGNWWCSADDRSALQTNEQRLKNAFFTGFFSAESNAWNLTRNRWDGVDSPPGRRFVRRQGEIEMIDHAWRNFREQYPPFLMINDDIQERWAVLPRASKLLGDEVDAWVRSPAGLSSWLLKRDGNLPESLHRVVLMTRVACHAQGGNGPVSRRAFKTLHGRYPNSSWAALTPYWYDKVGRL